MKDLLDKVKAWAASVPGAVKSNKVTFIVAGVVVVLAFVVGCGIGGSGKSAAPQLSPEEQAKKDAEAAADAEEAAFTEALKTVTLEAGIYSIVDGSKLSPVLPPVVSDGLSVGLSVVFSSVSSGFAGSGSGTGITALTLTLAPLIVAEMPLKVAYTFILPSDCTLEVLAGRVNLPL